MNNLHDASQKSVVATKLSARIKATNENHHLWCNRGIWWHHLTIHQADITAKRVRFSLKTRDLEKARSRRNRIFSSLRELHPDAA